MSIETTEFTPNSFAVPLMIDKQSPVWDEMIGLHPTMLPLAIGGVSAVMAATEHRAAGVLLLGHNEDKTGPTLVSHEFRNTFSDQIPQRAYALARNGIFVMGVARAVSDLMNSRGVSHGAGEHGILKYGADVPVTSQARPAISAALKNKHVDKLLTRAAYTPDLSYSVLNLAATLLPNGDFFGKVEAYIRSGFVQVQATSGVRHGHFAQIDNDRTMKPIERLALAISAALEFAPPSTRKEG